MKKLSKTLDDPRRRIPDSTARLSYVISSLPDDTKPEFSAIVPSVQGHIRLRSAKLPLDIPK